MKIYLAKTLDVRKDTIPADHKEKISLLRLAKVGVYIEGVGMRDEEFFLVAEDANDNLYLSFATTFRGDKPPFKDNPQKVVACSEGVHMYTKKQIQAMGEIDNLINQRTNGRFQWDFLQYGWSFIYNRSISNGRI